MREIANLIEQYRLLIFLILNPLLSYPSFSLTSCPLSSVLSILFSFLLSFIHSLSFPPVFIWMELKECLSSLTNPRLVLFAPQRDRYSPLRRTVIRTFSIRDSNLLQTSLSLSFSSISIVLFIFIVIHPSSFLLLLLLNTLPTLSQP